MTTTKEKTTTGSMVIKDMDGHDLVSYDREQLDLIKNTVAKNATDDELYFFLNVAKSYNLNPFKKEIWFIKYKNDVTIMTSRDGYLNICKQMITFDGVQGFPVHENDQFELKVSEGRVTDVTHTFGHKDCGPIVGAWAVARHIDEKNNIYTYVDIKEYRQTTPTWRKYPSAMIKKVAEADVLKRFAGISGLVTEEEMPRNYSQKASENKTELTRMKNKEKRKELEENKEKEEFLEDFIDAEYTEKEKQ